MIRDRSACCPSSLPCAAACELPPTCSSSRLQGPRLGSRFLPSRRGDPLQPHRWRPRVLHAGKQALFCTQTKPFPLRPFSAAAVYGSLPSICELDKELPRDLLCDWCCCVHVRLPSLSGVEVEIAALRLVATRHSLHTAAARMSSPTEDKSFVIRSSIAKALRSDQLAGSI